MGRVQFQFEVDESALEQKSDDKIAKFISAKIVNALIEGFHLAKKKAQEVEPTLQLALKTKEDPTTTLDAPTPGSPPSLPILGTPLSITGGGGLPGSIG